tara:strand:- start:130 stop:333 length:204 start_codon:yes stop_codon:yes gene_type:complete
VFFAKGNQMTTKRIIYPTADGGVAVIIPSTTIEACMTHIPANTPYKIVDVADIPTDRTFRNAWEYTA